MQTATDIIAKIQSIKSVLFKNGIEKVGLFGSVLRGENQNDSDLDILLHFRAGHENFKSFNLACDLLESAFPNTSLDVVTANGLSPYIGPHILAEVIYV